MAGASDSDDWQQLGVLLTSSADNTPAVQQQNGLKMAHTIIIWTNFAITMIRVAFRDFISSFYRDPRSRIPTNMSKIRQIDYTTPRTLVSYNGKRTVRMTGEENRYKFSGILIAGQEDAFAKIGEERKDWQKSAFPLPWTDSPDVVEPDVK